MITGARKVSRTLDVTLQFASDLTASEYAVLVALSEADEQELRLRDVSEELQWDRSRTSHQVTGMERRGLVRKRKVAGDKRAVMVALTTDGKNRLTAVVPDHVETVRRLVFDSTEDADRDAVADFLESVMAVELIPVGADEPDEAGR